LGFLKSFVTLLPGGKDLARRVSNFRRGRKLAQIGNTEARFTHIYEHNKWQDSESVSGVGSTRETTENIRDNIPSLLEGFAIASMLDAPCGDYNWFQMIERDKVRYIGGDIVKALVESNADKYENETTTFMQLDITRDALPDVELWLCRDCLIHLSFDLIDDALKNFGRSGVRYLLVSNYPEVTENHDIPTGHARMLNMGLAPFNFPTPLTTIGDPAEDFPSKELALWGRAQLFPRE